MPICTVLQFLELYKENKQQYDYDPLHPIECFQNHLKKVVLESYSGYEQQVDFARFFVLNAQVLNKIEFQVCTEYSSELVARQHKMLQVENRASRDAQFEFRATLYDIDSHVSKHIMICQRATPSESHVGGDYEVESFTGVDMLKVLIFRLMNQIWRSRC
jgi:hypothetical protein